MAVHGSTALIWPDQATPMELAITPGVPGQPGIGVQGTPPGNSISRVQLGTLDRTPPAAVDLQKVGVSIFRNRVDAQWPAVSDDANGSGMAGYWIYRDGLYFLRTAEPGFQDTTVQPAETHRYTIYAVDQHLNFSPAISFTVGTPVPQPWKGPPPSLFSEERMKRAAEKDRRLAPLQVNTGTPPADSGNGMDPRRTGVRSLGSYWGAAGEQIDTTSGNLNFSIPLLKAMGSDGWSVPFALSYNSQTWRQDPGGTWLIGGDVGYGFGWTLMAGSITPVWANTSQIDHYLYTDTTGAEYNLSVNNGGVWTSKETFSISYDSNANRLYFNDGSFWVMGCQSAAGEPDAGTLYPTQMEDSNGNYISLTYMNGNGSGPSNTSARLYFIQDARGPNNGATYNFQYTGPSAAVLHLDAIQNSIGTSENYTFNYSNGYNFGVPLNSPFSPPVSYGNTYILSEIGVTGMGAVHSFEYDPGGSGELIQMTTPLGGVLQWQYRTFTYTGSISIREVQTRWMTSMPGATTDSWAFTHNDSYDANYTFHTWTYITDSGAGTVKGYVAEVPITGYVLPTQYGEHNVDGTAPLARFSSFVSGGNSPVYLTTRATFHDFGLPSQIGYQENWYPDAYGNLQQYVVTDYPNLPSRVYNYTYLTDPGYTSIYIRNRMTQATVTMNNVTTTLGSSTYDSYPGNWCPLTDPGVGMHDPAYDVNFGYRGNLSQASPGNRSYCYQVNGAPYSSKDGMGRAVGISTDSSTNYSLPGAVTPGGNSNLATSVSYASSWAVTSVVGPNSASTSVIYDAFGRPQTSYAVDGVVTNYTYPGPTVQFATINNPPENPGGTKWTRTQLDGFGRVTQVQTGHDGQTMSIVDTQYAPCACSPLGKLWRVSQPYVPNATPVWTTYTYDGSGRTLTVTAPDGSVTTYSYHGNQTTVTDPAGKWKTFTKDAQGHLITVTEPNPAGGANFATNYTYNGAGQLTNVSLVRPEGTQQRSFQWSGPNLVSATNPENGTVTYTYNNANQVATRTDAKGQQTQYSYDGYGRLSLVQHFVLNNGNLVEDPNQRWTYGYDTNTIDSNFPAYNTAGRLATLQFGGFFYEYSYNTAGRIITQWMEGNLLGGTEWLTANYAWDNEGRLTQHFTDSGEGYVHQYDIMGRPSVLQESSYWGPGSPWNPVPRVTATNAPTGEMTSLAYNQENYTETFTYNSLRQLTHETVPGLMDMQYVYTAGQNNGRIAQSIDNIAGQTVNYTYDSLNRLTGAAATGGQWGQAYTFDGFGNLTAKTVTQGSGSNWTQASDPATNRLSSEAYDANGNWLPANSGAQYDVENRMVSRSFPLEGVTEQYFYDPSGKRVGKLRTVGTNQPSAFIYLYDQAGGRTTKECPVYSYLCNRATDDVYFAGKLVGKQRGKAVVTDRLGTVRADFSDEPDPPPTPPPPPPLSYLPYGEGQNPPTGAGSQVRFATYSRDSIVSNQDYADQRYYNPWLGRFNSPDRMTASNALVIPANWNKYAYVGGDPINKTDPRGMCSPEDDPPCFSADGTTRGDGGGGLDALNGWGGGLGDLGSTAEEVDIGDQRYGGDTTLQVGGGLIGAGNANHARNLFVNIQFSADCDGFLSSTLDVSTAVLQAITSDALIVDGTTANVLVGQSLFPNNERGAAAAAQATADAATGHANSTIAQWFAASPRTQAATQLQGNTIFANSTFPAGDALGVYTIFHESLHLFGLSDQDIYKAFGISDAMVAAQGSSAITTKLMSECARP